MTTAAAVTLVDRATGGAETMPPSAAYVGHWFWGRPSVYQLWTDLQEIRMCIKADFDLT